MNNNILIGDVIQKLKEISAETVNTCVTSPPYWGLRDYGTAGQIGLEKTPEEYVDKMVQVFREVRRVLRDDGTLWLNLGDSYSGAGHGYGGGSISEARKQHEHCGGGKHRKAAHGLKQKDLVGIPWMVAFALRADGWYLRQDIIWHKPNPMPESVKDRCTKAHEYIFLLSKSQKYYYDYEAIKEPVTGNSHPRGNGVNPKAKVPAGWNTEKGSHDTINGRYKVKQNESFSAAVKDIVSDRNKRSVWTVEDHSQLIEWLSESHPEIMAEYIDGCKHSVWNVSTKPFSGAHFATFPPDLIEPCILAGSPRDGIVLDPFFGAGTTGIVSMKNGRNYIGIELNPEYAEMAENRIKYGTVDPEEIEVEQKQGVLF